jgi:anti-sigma regulatory factor (Ser/Thr protein kinase)
MDMSSTCVLVSDTAHVAQARRAATAAARRLNFSEADAGRVALAATEAATNLVKHAGGGTVLVSIGPGGDAAAAVELVAVDQGPGMADMDACLVDGYSTAGSPGTGLGAVRRLSTEFDCYSRPGLGTAMLSRIAPSRAARLQRGALVAGGVSVPVGGEVACGDEWLVRFAPAATTVIVSDGLGHGPLAAEASRAAIAAFEAGPDLPLEELMARMHAALRPTRGAAVGVARVEPEAGLVRYCGVGNISTAILGAEQPRHLVSQNGTVGRDIRRIQEFTYAWPADGLLVLHSDGLGTRWRLQDYPGLASRHPSLIAGVLYRDFRRGRDDATVVVVQARTVS